MEYHLVFILIQLIVTILIVWMLFIDPTVEKTTGAFVFMSINFIFCILAGQSFFSVDAHGFTSSGVLVHNIISDMQWLAYVYLLFGYMNTMFMLYGGYLFMKKPWDEQFGKKQKEYY